MDDLYLMLILYKSTSYMLAKITPRMVFSTITVPNTNTKQTGSNPTTQHVSSVNFRLASRGRGIRLVLSGCLHRLLGRTRSQFGYQQILRVFLCYVGSEQLAEQSIKPKALYDASWYVVVTQISRFYTLQWYRWAALH